MRTALVVSVLALFLVWGASAQQDPPKPPETPVQTNPATQPPAAEAPAANADPMKMAAPKTAARNVPKSAVDNAAYVLGPEDQISVFVYQGPEFTGTHMIRPDGKITINLVGDVQASGLTPEISPKGSATRSRPTSTTPTSPSRSWR